VRLLRLLRRAAGQAAAALQLFSAACAPALPPRPAGALQLRPAQLLLLPLRHVFCKKKKREFCMSLSHAGMQFASRTVAPQGTQSIARRQAKGATVVPPLLGHARLRATRRPPRVLFGNALDVLRRPAATAKGLAP
jgi:hypothetical protein